MYLWLTQILLLLSSLFPNHWSSGRPKPSLLSASTHDYVTNIVERYGIAGMAVTLVARDSQHSEEWSEEQMTYGVANVQRDPVTQHSLFGIASNSKLFTAIAIGMLIQENTTLPSGIPLRWDTKITDILPHFKLQDPIASRYATLEDFMSMRSGLGTNDYVIDFSSSEDIVNRLRYIRPSAPFRQASQYSNLAYLLASHIIHLVTGQDFHEFVEKKIFKSFGLNETYYNITQARQTGDLTDMHLRINKRSHRCAEQLMNLQIIPRVCLGTPESIGWSAEHNDINLDGYIDVISSPHDMAKWLRTLLNPPTSLGPIIQHTISNISLPTGIPGYPELGIASYGMGQFAFTYRSHQVYGHTGGLAGGKSLIIRLPPNLGISILINDDIGVGPMWVILFSILDDLLDLPTINWEERIMRNQLIGTQRYPEPPFHLPTPEKPTFRRSDKPVNHVDFQVEGRYTNPAFGTIDLTLLKKFRSILSFVAEEVNLDIDSSAFIAKFITTETTHLVLVHRDGALYDWISVWIRDLVPTYPKLSSVSSKDQDRREGKETKEKDEEDDNGHKLGGKTQEGGKVATLIMGQGQTVFTPDGMGMFGGWSGPGPLVKPKQAVLDHVEQEAEAWFERC
ncbi:hypothetical protein TREMEDRAFT_59275 [Tremella mesenterica DSM 1558]|uniref:uncharacterized protein n=1 Tax=Tremella mesenterica (strain ATCC 24925 / CBS 8224 / DSM 1558 / NBRC 9311 / NRRL Y-6157 / RJB 2259-6 / UBC 559-6) TaxID=578456 RepID=UPI0003F49192|nr:uncharacterized protein TREMEDRAFT_59275 [Tremella mesenterica DSM 1558]EIW73114.1 hypothetical protein TREMEDRAFT_59275 [Tremella mesenterica DSM 1558]